MTTQGNFNAERTLDSLTDTVQISIEGGEVVVDQPEKRCRRKFKPKLEWKAAFKFSLDFRMASNSPVEHGQYDFESHFDGTDWRRSIRLKDVLYDTRLEYDVVTQHGTLDPAIIIDPN